MVRVSFVPLSCSGIAYLGRLDTPASFPLPSHIPGGSTNTEEGIVQHPMFRVTTGHQFRLEDLNLGVKPCVQVLPMACLCA
jgi:hypothetical protein